MYLGNGLTWPRAARFTILAFGLRIQLRPAKMKTPVDTKKELIERIIANRAQIQQFGVERIGIFGSFARDDARPDSDVDFFVDIRKEMKTLKNFVGLGRFLEKLTGRKVELITPQSLNPFIGKYILAEVEYVPFAA